MPKKHRREQQEDIETLMAKQVIVKFDNIYKILRKKELTFDDWQAIYKNILEGCKILPKPIIAQISLIEELSLWKYPSIIEGLLKHIEEAMNYERMRARGIGLIPIPQEEKPLSTLSIGGIPLFYEFQGKKGDDEG